MRKPRQEVPGGLHHVFNRGNNHATIFLDDEDYRCFLADCAFAIFEQRFVIHAWVLIPNHFHLLIETPEGNLGEGMKAISQAHALRLHDKRSSCGHVFEGRFGSKPVQTQRYLAVMHRYIALNPVKHGLRDHPDAWEWGSYPALSRGQGDGLVDPTVVSALLGPLPEAFATLLDPAGPHGPWTSISADPPRPTLEELFFSPRICCLH